MIYSFLTKALGPIASAGLFLLVTIQPAQAAVLWNQAPNPFRASSVDQVFPDTPIHDTYVVNDVTFLTDVSVDSVSTYFTSGQGLWPTAALGVLNIFSNDGRLDSEDPSMGTMVPITLTPELFGWKISASALSIELPAGDYWFGLTPIIEFATFGQEFHQSAASKIGADSHARNGGGGFGIGTDWQSTDALGLDRTYDAALTIEGAAIVIAQVPEPSATLSLIALQMMMLTRRRRRQSRGSSQD